MNIIIIDPLKAELEDFDPPKPEPERGGFEASKTLTRQI